MLVVCHGNVYRSPLAAAVLRTRLSFERVRSRGVAAVGGRPAALLCRKVGYTNRDRVHHSLQRHRAAPLTRVDVERTTHVLYMDAGNLARLQSFGCVGPELVPLAKYLGEAYIPDPAFQSPRDASKTLESVIEATLLFMEDIGV